jgi:hypothetical protein
MAKKINIVGAEAERIQDTGRALPRIEASELAAGLGAEPCGERLSGELDPISLAELGNELIKRLRSTGGRPSLTDATERCKVPLSPEDFAALEQIINAIEQQTGTKPSLGQIASVILRVHLDLLKKPTPTKQDEIEKLSKQEAEQRLSLTAVKALVEEQLKPVREELNRLKKDFSGRHAE